MKQWFYADTARQQHGPITDADIAARWRSGELAADTLVWHEGLPQWTLLAEVIGTLDTGIEPAAPEPLPADVSTGTEPAVATDDPSASVAAPAWTPPESFSPYAAPAATLAIPSRAVAGGHVVQAGFWKRTAAYVIDYFITSVMGGMAGFVVGLLAAFVLDMSDTTSVVVLQGVSFLLGVAISGTYFAWFHAAAYQATPGKMAVGIKVVRGNGEPITFVRGFGRYFGLVLSTLILLIGVIMAAFTARKQALHDLMCDTLVVDKWAYTAHPERQRPELGAVTWIILILGGILGLIFAGLMGFAMWGIFSSVGG